VVGHTPGDDARELCSGTLLAADSSLSRPFRAFGNMYCATENKEEEMVDSGATAGAWGVRDARGAAEGEHELAAQRARTRAAAGCDIPVEEFCEGSLHDAFVVVHMTTSSAKALSIVKSLYPAQHTFNNCALDAPLPFSLCCLCC